MRIKTSKSVPLLALAVSLCLLFAASAFGQGVRVMTHDSFDLSAEVVAAFTEETGIEVQLLPAGDAGEALSRAILTAGRPVADVLFGVDNSLLPRALQADLFEPYRSPGLDGVPEHLLLDPEHRITPVDAGYVAFNVDLDWFAANDLQPPADLDDLLSEEYRGLTVVMDPATSSPGLGFLLTTVDRYGEEGWLEYWEALRDNDVLVQGGWTDAYYTAFTRYGGDRPVVLSYASSPAAEVMFAETPLDEAPTANLFCDECVWLQIEGVGILRGTPNEAEAQAFVDFMLSPEVQADIPGVMFVYPVVAGTPLPGEFDEFAPEPEERHLAVVEGDRIAADLEAWLEEWTAVVVQGRSAADLR